MKKSSKKTLNIFFFIILICNFSIPFILSIIFIFISFHENIIELFYLGLIGAVVGFFTFFKSLNDYSEDYENV
jgi:hypothetical protein